MRASKPLVSVQGKDDVYVGRLDSIARSTVSPDFDLAWIDRGHYWLIALLSEIKYL